jgi:hypothetical protein
LKWWSISCLLVTSAAPSLAGEPAPPAAAPASPERSDTPAEAGLTWEAFLGQVERHHPLMDAARAGLAQLPAPR